MWCRGFMVGSKGESIDKKIKWFNLYLILGILYYGFKLVLFIFIGGILWDLWC